MRHSSFLAIALIAVTGCGGGAPLAAARSTLAVTQRVVTDLDARSAHGAASVGGEATGTQREEGWQALRRSLDDVRSRLDESEHAVDSWAAEDSGDLAWRTIAPCLASALTRVAAALHTLRLPDDHDLEEAITKARAESVDECHEPDTTP